MAGLAAGSMAVTVSMPAAWPPADAQTAGATPCPGSGIGLPAIRGLNRMEQVFGLPESSSLALPKISAQWRKL
jgi:hypothetical protein